eukprot:g1199.t1
MQQTFFVATLLLLAFILSDDIVQRTSAEDNAENQAAGSFNASLNDSGEESQSKRGTIAAKVETMVKKEFAEDVKEAESEMGAQYNQSAQSDKASLETVVRVSHHQPKVNGNTSSSSETGSLYNKSGDMKSELPSVATKSQHEVESDVDRMIDSHDNEFVLSKPKQLAAVTLDPVFIQDLTILYTSAAIMGLIFECFGQPVINGYFVAGSIVGTGGFMLIKELVQVQSLAQLGVQFLLFHLGLEFSLSKMRAVGGVALIGGIIEMGIFITLSTALAYLIGAKIGEGVFIGALLSLSSTCVVANCLETSKTSTTLYGQITIGTLILQDCTVGIMFALMPLIGKHQDTNENSELFLPGVILLFMTKLACLVSICTIIARYILPPLIDQLNKLFSQDLFQILLLSYCCLCALIIGWLGLSHELGAFVAGCMLSSSQQVPVAVKAIEGAKNIFMTLFMASIGLLMSPTFLLEHVIILTCSVIAIIFCKTVIVATVVHAFHFDLSTSLLVGLSLAQISEFAFVLLSIAVDYKLLQVEMYLLLLGVTVLSLLCTPAVITFARRRLLTEAPLSKVEYGESKEEHEV